jgi:hypothetical protein
MSEINNYIVQDYLIKEYSEIMAETREKRAFDLGMSYGYFQLYTQFKIENGKEVADQVFKSMLDENNEFKHFRNMVKISEKQETDVDKLIQDIFKNKKNIE